VVQKVIQIPLGNFSETSSPPHRGWELPYFLAGPENPLVEPAVRAIWEGSNSPYFPLVFYGPSGTGKTHLAHGLAETWKRIGNPGPVVLETAMDFHRQLVDALESQSLPEFLQRRVRAKLWILEDLETFAGKIFTQIQCSRILDQLRIQGTPHLATCRSLPGSIPGLEASFQARLLRGLVVNLALPSRPTRQMFLEELIRAQGIPYAPEAVSLLADRVQGTLAHLRKILMELAYVGSSRQGIQLPKVQTYLEQQPHELATEMRKIAEVAAQQFSVRLRDVRGPSRKKQVVYARGVAIYLARQLLGLGFQHIGEFFGNRDHTTILHSYQKTKKLLTEDPAVGRIVETLYETLHRQGFSQTAKPSPSNSFADGKTKTTKSKAWKTC